MFFYSTHHFFLFPPHTQVAVVPATLCGPDNRLLVSSMRGARLCSTGYRKGAGWTAPVGSLLASGALPRASGAPAGVAPDAAAVASFFGKVCAPRKTSAGPRANGTSGALWPEGLCDGCRAAGDQKAGAFCDEGTAGARSDAYAGYAGAITCLTDAGDTPVVMLNKADAKAADGTTFLDAAPAREQATACGAPPPPRAPPWTTTATATRDGCASTPC